ncbi:MAG: D-2-hydroxyacid dehydrogenase [Cephaloticoccus sp.]|nr:D-2-hydroxyacid dehydrogenase [Cephaloticoccus sp.]MCF7761198.1 D-2-hydroxyacid dehydrogenase [Cephaloticoccus sp.]
MIPKGALPGCHDAEICPGGRPAVDGGADTPLDGAHPKIMRMLIAYPAAAKWTWSDPVAVANCDFSAAAIEAAMTPDTEVLVTDAMPGKLDKGDGLKWVHLLSAGYNQAIGHPLTTRPGVRVTNSAGLCAVHMAEFVLGQILRQVKRFDEMGQLHRAKAWPDRAAFATPALRGRRALIVGYGGVGRETARLLTTFGVAVDVVQRTKVIESYTGYLPDPDMGDRAGVLPQRRFTVAEMDTALAEADFIVLTIPLTQETKHLMNRATLAAIKPGAVLINVARGGLIEMSALSEALSAGRLAHACLDVFTTEPLPADDPIWVLPGITLTPHMSGVMPDAAHWHEDLLRQNLQRYRTGAPLLNEIRPDRLTG